MRRWRWRRRTSFLPRFDGLEGRVTLSAAAAGAIRPDAASPYEFLNSTGKVSKTHAPEFGFTVHVASTITVEVSGLPRADRVRLEASSNDALLGQQSGGANFSIVLEPGNDFVQVVGKKRARFAIALYSVEAAPASPSTGTGQGGGGTSTGGANPVSSLLGTYQGVATTQIVQFNPLNGQTVATNIYRQATTMVLGPRVTDGAGNYEDNPFDLLVAATDNAGSLTGGNLDLNSATVISTDLGPLLLNYWTLELTANGFSGVLSDNQSSKGVALNSVIGLAYLSPVEPQFGSTPNMYVFQDASGGAQYQTTLSATYTGTNTLDVKIQGVGIAGGSIAVISIDFVATRVP